ncbi:MAG: hypothetical protein ACI815_000895 [Psychroserpens sp.]|jgi:hypothetical protein
MVIFFMSKIKVFNMKSISVDKFSNLVLLLIID